MDELERTIRNLKNLGRKNDLDIESSRKNWLEVHKLHNALENEYEQLRMEKKSCLERLSISPLEIINIVETQQITNYLFSIDIRLAKVNEKLKQSEEKRVRLRKKMASLITQGKVYVRSQSHANQRKGRRSIKLFEQEVLDQWHARSKIND